MLASYLIKQFLVQLTWFIMKSKEFNQRNIASDIAALTGKLRANGPLQSSIGTEIFAEHIRNGLIL